jgi:adenine-specific DNA methylase
MKYPKRLIEVDLPIKRISAHARREKSIRHGHISTLHIWWARRPLAACRAVLCASLWIDPVDELCPQKFRDDATKLINDFAKKAASDKELTAHCSEDIWAKWNTMSKNNLDSKNPAHLNILRFALLDFIADFANWDNSIQKDYLETARALTQSTHEALGGLPGTRPLVVDPFAGGGSIPLEALRVGADAFASDLNPVAVLLNKVVLEYIPKYGQKLADEVRKWGTWIKEEAEKELAEFYPKDEDGSTPIAYLWARTIKCEGPGCGVEVPLIKNPRLVNRPNKKIGIKLKTENKKIIFEFTNTFDNIEENGTVMRGSATCLSCGFTTPLKKVKAQLNLHNGGADDSKLYGVILKKKESNERIYRIATNDDYIFYNNASIKFSELRNSLNSNLIPIEELPSNKGHRAIGSPFIYGMRLWEDLFNARQKLSLAVITKHTNILFKQLSEKYDDQVFVKAIYTLLSLSVSSLSHYLSSLSTYISDGMVSIFIEGHSFPMRWDFAEANPLMDRLVGGYEYALLNIVKTIESYTWLKTFGNVNKNNAENQLLPSNSVQAFFTDPPYYDSVPYADVSDYLYVWLKRSIGLIEKDLFDTILTPKEEQIVVNHPNSEEDKNNYELRMKNAFRNQLKSLDKKGIGAIVFANKSTLGWEAIIFSIIESGWMITASWPIDTERSARMNANNTASLESSVHIIVRPRENENGSVSEEIGDWRTVLAELPIRIAEWMPRLAGEGVVGADAIFACIGPALEIFSRYSKVEKVNGDVVTLREYLEQVWAAVAKEALNMIFKDADSTGLEEDARLTAMWLWTLSTGNGSQKSDDGIEENDSSDDEEGSKSKVKLTGFMLEYDAARKIAQGLGAHLEKLSNLVEVKGDKARLLPVSERMKYLFGKENQITQSKQKKKEVQVNLFQELDEVLKQEYKVDIDTGDSGFTAGKTVLDKVHQSMLLFASGRTEALKRMLIEDGIGRDTRYWNLAQSLSALYPSSSDEKRFVDGVLVKKKGFGF